MPISNVSDDDAIERLGLVTVEIAGQTVALPVARIRRVLDPLPVTRLPGGDAATLGVVDLAGESVPLFDGAAALGLDAVATDDGVPGRIVVVETGTAGTPVGLAVDRVLDIVEVDPASIEAPSARLGETGAVTGFLRLDGRLAAVIAPERAFGKEFEETFGEDRT